MAAVTELRAFSDELSKIAARKGLKIIRDLMSRAQKAFDAGDIAAGKQMMSQADDMARTKGVIKPSQAGSEVKELGRGSEGAATMVADPEHGVAVRKLYDPEGITSGAVIKRKHDVGTAIGENPHVAQYYGQRPTQRGTAMQFSEYVPQGNIPMQGTRAQGMQRATEATQQASARAGFSAPQDLRADNMVLDARTGQYKTVDFIPAKPSEIAARPMNTPDHQVVVTPEGRDALMNKKFNPDMQSSGTLKQSLLAKRPSGVRRPMRRPAPRPTTQRTVAQGSPQRRIAPTKVTKLTNIEPKGGVKLPGM